MMLLLMDYKNTRRKAAAEGLERQETVGGSLTTKVAPHRGPFIDEETEERTPLMLIRYATAMLHINTAPNKHQGRETGESRSR